MFSVVTVWNLLLLPKATPGSAQWVVGGFWQSFDGKFSHGFGHDTGCLSVSFDHIRKRLIALLIQGIITLGLTQSFSMAIVPVCPFMERVVRSSRMRLARRLPHYFAPSLYKGADSN